MSPTSSGGICFLFRISNLRYRQDFNLISLRDSNAHEDILTASLLSAVPPEIFLDIHPYHIPQQSRVFHTILHKNSSLLAKCTANAFVLHISHEMGVNKLYFCGVMAEVDISFFHVSGKFKK
jgi:hypothetical protein